MGAMLVNFGWVRTGELAGMGFPDEGSWAELASLGIGAVLSLTERMPPGDPTAAGLVHRHMPIIDFGVPSRDDLRATVTWMDDQIRAGRPVVVHCGAGVGRTGTLLAAYLVHAGAEPGEAIAEVRAARPGSIETAQQRALVESLAGGRERR